MGGGSPDDGPTPYQFTVGDLAAVRFQVDTALAFGPTGLPDVLQHIDLREPQ